MLLSPYFEKRTTIFVEPLLVVKKLSTTGWVQNSTTFLLWLKTFWSFQKRNFFFLDFDSWGKSFVLDTPEQKWTLSFQILKADNVYKIVEKKQQNLCFSFVRFYKTQIALKVMQIFSFFKPIQKVGNFSHISALIIFLFCSRGLGYKLLKFLFFENPLKFSKFI